MNKEDVLQAKIVVWFKNEYQINGKGVIFSVPNGGSRNVIEAKKLKATGLLAGVSDLIIVLESKVLFIELKTDVGIQSDTQKKFQNLVTNLNHEYHIIRSLEQFKELIWHELT
jgi:hypothetical protein